MIGLPITYSTIQRDEIFMRPSNIHLLGTNEAGQDVLFLVLGGVINSIILSILVVLGTNLIALILGSLMALYGKSLERLLLRVIDIFIVLPSNILIMAISIYIKPSLFWFSFVLILFGWAQGTKLIWSHTKRIVNKDYINAVKSFGGSGPYILRKHIFREVFPLLLVIAIQTTRRVIFLESSLSFLGITNPEIISLGKLINNSLNFLYLEVWRWCLLPPLLGLVGILVTLSSIGIYIEGKIDRRFNVDRDNRA
ncbi:MAG: ABC transporter permease [bacterium]|nr:ABC transporter permease [bacterium]